MGSISKMLLLVAVLPMALIAGVWNDALLRVRGAVDRNGNGLWNATDYTSANTEIPDVMHAAESAPLSTKISYSVTSHSDSNVRIVNQEVKLASEGRTVTRPVLYFPQPHFVEGSVNKARIQYFKLFNGTAPTTSDRWSAVMRIKPEAFFLQKKAKDGSAATTGSSWFFNFPGTGSGSKEMRLGVRSKDGGATGFISLCVGNTTNNEKEWLIADKDWMEVSIVVDGPSRTIRLSCGLPGKMRRWATHVVPEGSEYPETLKPTIMRFGDCARGSIESCDYGNADAFRGYLDTLGVWDRTLTDAEVVEAFGDGNPNIVKVGEDGAADRMFVGAKATGSVTLDPTVHDQRLWPASFGNGAVINIPFSVDKYRADWMQALRVMPRKGSAATHFTVRIDGDNVGGIDYPACGQAETPIARFLRLKSNHFTIGNHMLSLACETSGDAMIDSIEIVGSWRIGDGSGNDVSYDSDTSWGVNIEMRKWADTYYASSKNMKDYAWYLGGSLAQRRDKVIYWNVADGLAEHANYMVTCKLRSAGGAAGYTTKDRKVQMLLNGEEIDSRIIDGNCSFVTAIPSGKVKDGLNELRYAIEELPSAFVWINPYEIDIEMTDCKSDWHPGLVIMYR